MVLANPTVCRWRNMYWGPRARFVCMYVFLCIYVCLFLHCTLPNFARPCTIPQFPFIQPQFARPSIYVPRHPPQFSILANSRRVAKLRSLYKDPRRHVYLFDDLHCQWITSGRCVVVLSVRRPALSMDHERQVRGCSVCWTTWTVNGSRAAGA